MERGGLVDDGAWFTGASAPFGSESPNTRLPKQSFDPKGAAVPSRYGQLDTPGTTFPKQSSDPKGAGVPSRYPQLDTPGTMFPKQSFDPKGAGIPSHYRQLRQPWRTTTTC